MATKIRLKRMGKIRSPHYRIVVMDSRQKRDGRAIEELGIYHPKNDPSVIEVNSERMQYWLGVGAQPTEAIVALLKVTGDWQKFTGEKAPAAGVKPQAERKDKDAIFAAALAEDDAPAAEAISKKKGKAAEAESDSETETPDSSETPSADAPAEGAASGEDTEAGKTPSADEPAEGAEDKA